MHIELQLLIGQVLYSKRGMNCQHLQVQGNDSVCVYAPTASVFKAEESLAGSDVCSFKLCHMAMLQRQHCVSYASRRVTLYAVNFSWWLA